MSRASLRTEYEDLQQQGAQHPLRLESTVARRRVHRGKGTIQPSQRLVDHLANRTQRVTARHAVLGVHVAEQLHLGSFVAAHRETRDRTVPGTMLRAGSYSRAC